MDTQRLIESVTAGQVRTDWPWFNVGDTIDVHARIVEGNKERIQVFRGVLMARWGRGIHESIRVRRIVDGIGVERVWPLNSPLISKVEVVRRGDARRARLYFLRDRIGKARRLRDQRRGMKHVAGEKTVQ